MNGLNSHNSSAGEKTPTESKAIEAKECTRIFLDEMQHLVEKYRAGVEYDLMKYKLTSDALQIALWDMDVVTADPLNPKNNFVWSPEFRRMLGFSSELDFPNEFQSWSNRLHPEDKERVLNAFAEHINDRTGKTSYDVEYRLQTRDRTYRYFHAFGNTLRDSNGVPLRVAGAIMDIDAKKKIEKEHEQQEKQLRLQNRIAVAFLSQSNKDFDELMAEEVEVIADVVDIDRVSIWRNTVTNGDLFVSQIYRWERQLGGVTLSSNFFTNVTYDTYTPNWKKTFAENRIVNGPAYLMSEKEAATLGKFGAVSVFASPVFIDGSLWGFVLFEDCRNERYFSEESANVMCSASFLFVNAVMRAETENEIQTALFKLQEANRIKDEFLTRMSHEMLTPLNGITGITQLMKMTENIDEIKLYLDEISISSWHLFCLIRDLLDVTEREGDVFNLASSVFSFETMSQDILSIAERDLAKKKQTISCNIDSSMPAFLVGDKERLAQIITNLLENAMKFTPDYGEILLSAQVLSEENDTVMLEIEVSDTGIGIPKEDHSGIFKVFKKMDESSTRQHKGIGLGLPLAKRIVEMMGGKIWVNSEIGQGSRFTFTCQMRQAFPQKK